MSQLGTNYADQVESNLHNLIRIYTRDLTRAGLKNHKKKASVMSVKKLNQREKNYAAPLFSLLFDSATENLALFKPKAIITRFSISGWPDEQDLAYIKKHENEDTKVTLFLPQNPKYTEKIILMMLCMMTVIGISATIF